MHILGGALRTRNRTEVQAWGNRCVPVHLERNSAESEEGGCVRRCVSVAASSRDEESTQFQRLAPDEPFCFCRTGVGVSSVRRPYTSARDIQSVRLPSPLPCLDALLQATGSDKCVPDQYPI